MEGPLGVGPFGPGFKLWLHHSTNCATWGKLCVTTPKQYEVVISISTWSTFQGDFKIKSSSAVSRRSRVQLFRALRLQPIPETEVQLGHFFVTLEQPLSFLELLFTHPLGKPPTSEGLEKELCVLIQAVCLPQCLGLRRVSLKGGGGGLFTQLYLTLCEPMDCSLPGSFVHGI